MIHRLSGRDRYWWLQGCSPVGASIDGRRPEHDGLVRKTVKCNEPTHGVSILFTSFMSKDGRKYPAWCKKSHILLVLFTSIFTRSRASRLRSLPPRRAYSRTRVSLTMRYGFGRIRIVEHNACSAGVRRCKDGAFTRLSGAATVFDLDLVSIVSTKQPWL